ncbi:MAG: glycosyltransferase family 4 protein [Firmicutes bacterium]|nr:glycosyltransferase family 4 protein [Bacillota bacterium]
MKKICMLTDNITSVGGIQRCVCMLSNELIKNNMEVTILCINKFNDGNVPFNLSSKVKVEYVKKVSVLNKILFWWTKIITKLDIKKGILKNLKKIQTAVSFKSKYSRNNDLLKKINDGKYDYVIVNGGSLVLLVGIYADKINSKLIGWQHSSCASYFEDKKDNLKYYKRLYKDCLNKLNNYVVLTNNDKKWFLDNMNYKCETIYHMKPFTTTKTANINNKVFISVGRLVDDKNYELLIEAFNIFAAKEPDWRLVIYGEGPKYQELNDLILKYKLENRVFIKKFKNDISEAYLDSSIFITSSKIEGFGLVLIEAMECGLPIIATNIPAFNELVKKDNGIIIKKNTAQSLAEEMYKLCLNKKEIKKYSENNKKEALNFSKESVTHKWLNLMK